MTVEHRVSYIFTIPRSESFYSRYSILDVWLFINRFHINQSPFLRSAFLPQYYISNIHTFIIISFPENCVYENRTAINYTSKLSTYFKYSNAWLKYNTIRINTRQDILLSSSTFSINCFNLLFSRIYLFCQLSFIKYIFIYYIIYVCTVRM